jgi:hypothetical protein
MRNLLLMIVAVTGVLFAVDMWAFDSRLRNTVRVHALTQAAMFQSQVHYVLRKLD